MFAARLCWFNNVSACYSLAVYKPPIPHRPGVQGLLREMSLEVHFPQNHIININPILEPPSLPPLASSGPIPVRSEDHIIPTHHPLLHFTFRIIRPMLDSVATFPFHAVVSVLVLVPELHGDFVGEGCCEKFFAEAVGP